MSINEYPNCKSLIINALKSRKFSGLKEARKHFLINILLCFLSIKGRINFLQLARFSEYCEQYYRIHFENKFNFQDFNLSLITGRRIKECIVAFDPSYIPKSGKKTFGTGRYWSGCAKQAKWGLDICGLTTCQARSENKLNFHFNTALTVVNLARIDMIIIITQEND